MSPLQVLRLFLQQDPACRAASTQAGFAKLVGRSETLIRSLEKNRTKMSKKLASHISYLLGVDESWLMRYPVDRGPIPAAEEGEFIHSDSLRFTINPPVSGEKLDPRILQRSQSSELGSESIELRSENHATTALEASSLNPIMQTMIGDLIGKLQAELTAYCENSITVTSNPFTELYDWLLNRAQNRSVPLSLPSKEQRCAE